MFRKKHPRGGGTYMFRELTVNERVRPKIKKTSTGGVTYMFRTIRVTMDVHRHHAIRRNGPRAADPQP